MKYMDVKTASELWGITGRRVRILCNDGRIDGAVRTGWSWMIPEDTPKPRDGRVLRRFKNMDIRPGSVDVEKLRELSDSLSIEKAFSEEECIRRILARTISFLCVLENLDITYTDAMKVLNGDLAYNLSLKEHLIIINFASIVRSFAKKDFKWGEGLIKETYIRLLQGIEDVTGEYREGFVSASDQNGDGVKISVAMETMMNQYENSWSSLHGLASAVILSGEVSRIKPYEHYSMFFLYLLLAGELMRNDILPPLLDPSYVDEAKAAYSIVYSKGAYTDVTAFVERMIVRTYGELEEDV